MAKFPGYVPEGGTVKVPVRTSRPVGFIPDDGTATACQYCGKDFSDKKRPADSVVKHERVCPERVKEVVEEVTYEEETAQE